MGHVEEGVNLSTHGFRLFPLHRFGHGSNPIKILIDYFYVTYKYNKPQTQK